MPVPAPKTVALLCAAGRIEIPKGGQSGARGSLLVRGAARKWRNFEENHGNDGHEVHFLQKTMEMIEIP